MSQLEDINDNGLRSQPKYRRRKGGYPSALTSAVGYRTSAQRVIAIEKVGVDNGGYEKYGESRTSRIQRGFLPLSMP